ncbi:sigma-54 interaction domain-containing protein [Anaeromicrobium sediminis]|uniref:Fis family transcriptional regulator n=1 Tax=Anaeromicrobium sediminis TaxID=1478221 RepID=A0A267MI62_9FIRM|nr:sigma 54-interacting transcriptional regulator [Anaeromicrobium sediminis]PAB59102.1 hypothetical protein CCE28_11325 [Anaeromicrobium sediminis]
MKKKLILITLEVEPKEKYTRDLKDFFEDYLEVEGYSIREGIYEKIQGDLALVTSPILPGIAQKYLSEEIEIIYMNRTFMKGSLDPLHNIPEGTEAMLVNNNDIGTIGTISLLYEMGIKHIDFKPVYPNLDNIPDLKYAVTPGQMAYVPKTVEKVFDIGWRVIDISTLMNIITKLDILNERIDEKLERYLKNIIPINQGFNFIFENTNKMKNQLNVILDVIDDGVMVVDKEYKVLHLNKSIEKILGIQEQDILNKNIKDLIKSSSVLNELVKEDNIQNYIVKYNLTNKSLIVTKRPIKTHGNIYGYVLIIKDKTEIENLESQLRKQLVDKGHVAKYHFQDIIGVSENLIECKTKAKKISKIDSPVLIIGESGTGKELFAQSIHNFSRRKNQPFLAVNCATLSSDLLESELFGYEEGAFTGAKRGGKKGLFELAHKGSLFLDEIGELPVDTQVKLLRVLQEKEVMRMGGIRVIPVDVRVIAATNRNLRELMEKGKFRSDLYYRLNVLPLYLPPLRERKDDILYLIKDILNEISMGNKQIHTELLHILKNNYWGGNIRELRNCIEYMAYMGDEVLTIRDLPPDFSKSDCSNEKIEEEWLFSQLHMEDNNIAKEILSILKYKNAGRRAIYDELIERNYNISEHKIRNIMDFLNSNEYITYGKGRKGSFLTHKGKEVTRKIK